MEEEALADALVERGLGLLAEFEEGDQSDEVLTLLVRWLEGARLTDRADEPERRLSVAEEAFDELGGTTLAHRLHAQAVLALPAGHEQRDAAAAVAELRACLDAGRAEHDAEEALNAITALLDAEVGDDALLDEGDRWAERADPVLIAPFRIAASSFAMGRYIEARDAEDADAAAHWARRQDDYAASDDDEIAALADRAAQCDRDGRYEEAADAYRALHEQSDAAWPPAQHMAMREGELRLMTGNIDRAVEVLAAVLPHVEASYLTTVANVDIEEAYDRLTRAVRALAAAFARQGEWSDVVQTLDRPRGLRARYRASLRDDPAAEHLLTLERELDAATRGATDEAAAARAQLLEEYRQVRPQLAADRLASPTVAELGALLEPGEALAMIGMHFTGTVAVVVAAGDRDRPAGRLLMENVGTRQWLEIYAGGGEWLDVFVHPGATLEPGLSATIDGIDEVIGRWLRSTVDEVDARRLTLVPESIMHLLPWAALPSLSGIDVVIAASASEVVRERRARSGPAERTALVVANPTLDLRVAGAACRPVAGRLEGVRFDVDVLVEVGATEPALLEAVRGHALLHFAGHGRSEPRLSGLELQPSEAFDGDPFQAWADAVTEWREPPDESEDDDEEPASHEQIAEVPGVGRLSERRWTRGDRLDRRLERRDSTLVASYAGDRLVRLAELWSAADLLLTEGLDECRLAVLVACSSGAGVGRSDEAQAGVPVALQLAGIDTVIGTHWEVDEALAAVWTEGFYSRLAAAGAPVELAALVRETGEELRDMSAAEARERLLALADHVDDPFAAMELEAYAHRLPDPPFAEPGQWAAFYLIGRPTLELVP